MNIKKMQCGRYRLTIHIFIKIHYFFQGKNITFVKTYYCEKKSKLTFIGPQLQNNCVINSVENFLFLPSLILTPKSMSRGLLFFL